MPLAAHALDSDRHSSHAIFRKLFFTFRLGLSHLDILNSGGQINICSKSLLIKLLLNIGQTNHPWAGLRLVSPLNLLAQRSFFEIEMSVIFTSKTVACQMSDEGDIDHTFLWNVFAIFTY